MDEMSTPSGPRRNAGRIRDQRERAHDVERLVREGETDAAEKAMRRATRDVLPDLPLRFTVRLRRVQPDAVARAMALLQAGGALDLDMEYEKPGRLVVTTGGATLGTLPATARDLVAQGAGVYEAHPVSLAVSDGSARMAIELVRREMRICSSCGSEHDSDTINCPTCRQRRRRKGEAEGTFEPPPVALQRALDAIVESSED